MQESDAHTKSVDEDTRQTFHEAHTCAISYFPDQQVTKAWSAFLIRFKLFLMWWLVKSLRTREVGAAGEKNLNDTLEGKHNVFILFPPQRTFHGTGTPSCSIPRAGYVTTMFAEEDHNDCSHRFWAGGGGGMDCVIKVVRSKFLAAGVDWSARDNSHPHVSKKQESQRPAVSSGAVRRRRRRRLQSDRMLFAPDITKKLF